MPSKIKLSKYFLNSRTFTQSQIVSQILKIPFEESAANQKYVVGSFMEQVMGTLKQSQIKQQRNLIFRQIQEQVAIKKTLEINQSKRESQKDKTFFKIVSIFLKNEKISENYQRIYKVIKEMQLDQIEQNRKHLIYLFKVLLQEKKNHYIGDDSYNLNQLLSELILKSLNELEQSQTNEQDIQMLRFEENLFTARQSIRIGIMNKASLFYAQTLEKLLQNETQQNENFIDLKISEQKKKDYLLEMMEMAKVLGKNQDLTKINCVLEDLEKNGLVETKGENTQRK